METLREELKRASQQRAARLGRYRAKGPGRGVKTLARLRCQGCGAWVEGARALRWEMCDPRTERETTLMLCGLECPWLFTW